MKDTIWIIFNFLVVCFVSNSYRNILMPVGHQLLTLIPIFKEKVSSFSKQAFILVSFIFTNQSVTQPEITCSKLIIETLKQGVKYVQN